MTTPIIDEVTLINYLIAKFRQGKFAVAVSEIAKDFGTNAVKVYRVADAIHSYVERTDIEVTTPGETPFDPARSRLVTALRPSNGSLAIAINKAHGESV
jgi:hypothetical protein